MAASDPRPSVERVPVPVDTRAPGGTTNAYVAGGLLVDPAARTDALDAAGIAVPVDLVDRTIRESAAYYTGGRESLSPDVRRFQRLLFADDAWVRDVDASYRLNSALFGVWERILRAERRRLERASRE